MKHDDLEELKLLIAHNLDLLEVLDIIGLSYPEVLDLLDEQIEEQYEELRRACE